MASPLYRWNERAGRYVDERNRFVGQAEVRRALEQALLNAQRRGRSLSAQLRSGLVALPEWQQGMRRLIKQVHLYSAAVAAGGWQHMTYTDFGNLGPVVRFHYGKLQQFAEAIAAGLPLDGRFTQRVELYLLAGNNSYWMQEGKRQQQAGATEERNLLHPADHCPDCLAETARSWQPIGALRPVGQRRCLSRCRCTLEYR